MAGWLQTCCEREVAARGGAADGEECGVSVESRFSIALEPGYDVVDIVDGGGKGMTRRKAVGGGYDDGAGAVGEEGAEAVVGFSVAADESAAVDVEMEGAKTGGVGDVRRLVNDGVEGATAGGNPNGGEPAGEEERDRIDGVGYDSEGLEKKETPAGYEREARGGDGINERVEPFAEERRHRRKAKMNDTRRCSVEKGAWSI